MKSASSPSNDNSHDTFDAPLPSLLGAREIEARLRCSRWTAYDHLRKCAARYHGRRAGQRGLLRVSQQAWLRYETEVLKCGSIVETASITPLSETPTGRAYGARPGAPTAKRPKRAPSSGSESSLIPTPRRYATRP
jgi:hypothetical protein